MSVLTRKVLTKKSARAPGRAAGYSLRNGGQATRVVTETPDTARASSWQKTARGRIGIDYS